MKTILIFSLLLPATASGSSAALRAPGDGVFQSLSSKVAALESQLSETELQNKQELAAHQVSYERKLKEAREANLQLATSNMHLAQEVQDLHNSNGELRKKAVQLKEDGRKWMDDWNTLKGNLTAVLEFTSNTISDYRKADSASELSVLEELSKRDEVLQAQLIHKQRVDEIAGSADEGESLALLQVSSPRRSQSNPKSILSMLEHGLDDLAREKSQKEGDLLDKFKNLMLSERKRREALLAEESSLKKQKDKELALQARLSAAAQHLQMANQHLEEQGRSLRMYTQRLGIRPLPHSNHAAEQSAVATSPYDLDTPLVPAEQIPSVTPVDEVESPVAQLPEKREPAEAPEDFSVVDDSVEQESSVAEPAVAPEPAKPRRRKELPSARDAEETEAKVRPSRGLFSWWSR